MQIKKEAVKDRLLEAAKVLFLSQGYEKTSLRSIVKKAGTTLGNYTNYFENKEAIFEALVSPVHQGFNQFLMNHDEEEETVMPETFGEIDIAPVVEGIILTMPFVFTENFVLLVECASGTKYEGYGDEIRDFMKRHFMEHLEGHVEAAYGDIAAGMFLQGLVNIIKHNNKPEEVRKLVARHIAFFSYGTYAMISQEAAHD